MQRLWLLIFLTTIAIDWPPLPFNMRLADVGFVGAAAAILAGSRSWSLPRLQFLDAAILIYLAGSAISVVFSPEPRAGGIELIRQTYVAVIYVVIALAVRQGLAPTIGSGLALGGAALAITGLLAAALQMAAGIGSTMWTQVMPLPYLGDTVRLRALTASEAMLVSLLAVATPIAVRHPTVTESRARQAAVAGLFTVAAALTFSHSIAGFAVAMLIALWAAWDTRPYARRAALAATILIVIAFNFAASVSIRSIGASPFRDDTVFHYSVDSGRTRIAGVDVEYETMSYLRLKQVALDAFLSRPLVGVGLDRFPSLTEAAYRDGRLTESYRAVDPHSTFAGRLAETGAIGGITLLLLWLAIAAATTQLVAAERTMDWLTVGAAAAIAGTFVNTLNADVMNFRFLWVVLGLVRGLSAVTRSRD